MSLHHWFSFIKVWAIELVEKKPWFEIKILVKVIGSIIAKTDPKLDISANKTEKIIMGKWKFLIFNLTFWNI